VTFRPGKIAVVTVASFFFLTAKCFSSVLVLGRLPPYLGLSFFFSTRFPLKPISFPLRGPSGFPFSQIDSCCLRWGDLFAPQRIPFLPSYFAPLYGPRLALSFKVFFCVLRFFPLPLKRLSHSILPSNFFHRLPPFEPFPSALKPVCPLHSLLGPPRDKSPNVIFSPNRFSSPFCTSFPGDSGRHFFTGFLFLDTDSSRLVLYADGP